MLTKTIRRPKPIVTVLSREQRRQQHTKQLQQHATDMHLLLEVGFDGDIDADVAFIGEGPGEVEVRKRTPFVGPSGLMLWKYTDQVGLDRSHVYATNVMKRQLALDGREPPVDEVLQWIDLIQWELAQLPNVKTVFCLGNLAMRAMLDFDGITKHRGSVYDATLPNGKAGKVVCTFNPAYVLPNREPKFELFFGADVRRVVACREGTFREHKVETIINPTKREVLAYIRDLKRAREPIALDDEAINKELACIGLANKPHEAICINFRDLHKNRFSVRDELEILYAIQGLCDSHRMIGQNGQFDSYFSWLHAMLVINFYADTLLAHHTLFPTLPHNLGFLTAQYMNMQFYKDEGDDWSEGGDIDTYWRYNGKDCCATWVSWQKMEKELRQEKLDKFFFDHVMRAQHHLYPATVHGVAVDAVTKERVTQECLAEVDKLRDKFHERVFALTGEPEYKPNPGSWQQLQVLFFDKLGLEGRGKSTDEENRKEIIKNPKTPPLAKEMLAALDTFKEEAKFTGTYAKSRVSPDGRYRCEYKQFGVSRAPGRLSSSQLLVEKEGGNMQNQPVRARAMYVADPGMVFGYFDLAQAEAQVVSFRADIPSWKEQFARARKDGSYDCHRALASEMFRIPYDQVPKEDWDENLRPTKRYVSKRCRHGLNYRMDVYRLSQVTGLPYHEAARAYFLYHAITRELKEWWKAEEFEFRKCRAIFNGLGRRFKVYQAINDDVLESIIAFYAQSTIGDKVVETWYKSEEDDRWPKAEARIAIDVHDNLVCISSKRKIKTCLNILREHAESPIFIQDIHYRRKPEPLIIPAEVKMSYPSLWVEAKDKRKKNKAGKWCDGYVEDPKGLHRWSELEKVTL